MNLSPSPMHEKKLTGLLLCRSCSGESSCNELVSEPAISYPEDRSTALFPIRWLADSSALSSGMFLESWVECYICQFRSQLSAVTHSQYFEVGVFPLIAGHCQKKLLWQSWGKCCSLGIGVFRRQLTVCPFSKATVIGAPHDLWSP